MTGSFAVVAFSVALVGCQSLHYNTDYMTSTQGGDVTLVVGGCSGSLGRGYEVCRFMDGAPIDSEKITLVIPYGENSVVANVRMRYGARLFNTQVNAPFLTVKYSDLFYGPTFNKNHDGPIQIIVKTINKDGSFYETLGYLFVVVLTKGYNQEAGEKINRCVVTYDDLGGSEVECN